MFKCKQSRLLLLALSATSAFAYVPIVLVHGVLSDDYGIAPNENYSYPSTSFQSTPRLRRAIAGRTVGKYS